MLNKTEIELRGKFDKSEFEDLFSFLSKNGKLLKHYKRLSVDLSPGFDPETRTWNSSGTDLRIKKSDSEEKISLKVGEYDSPARKEIEIGLKEGEILDTLSLFEAMGYKTGMIYFDESWEFDYKACEIKLARRSEDVYWWEIESNGSQTDIDQLIDEFKLKPFSKTEFKDFIDWENQNVNQLYSFELVKKLLKETFNQVLH